MDPKAVVSILGVWTGGRGSLRRKLTSALMDGVRHGGLAPGVRLPSERALAAALKISRTTVVAAYDALRAAGWVESRHGSGTWVRTGSQPVAMARSAARTAALAASPVLGLIVSPDADDVVDFGLGSPLPLAELDADLFVLPTDEYAALIQERFHYPLGLPLLRQAIADRYSREGLDTRPDQILVTNGAQHAIALCAASCLQRGDVALVEDPTYFGALDAFRTAGARLSAMPVAADGVAPGTLRDRIGSTAARLVYLTPTSQNPTGAVMPLAARKEIARIASDTATPIIDDRTMADLVLEGSPPPPLAIHAPTAPILTVGSLSKLIGPSLRVGWLRAPEPLVQRVARVKTAMDLGSPLITQAVAARLLRAVDRARALRQRQLKPRRERLASLLKAHLPEWRWSRPAGGLFLWVRLPGGDAREFAQVALRHGVVIVPGPSMSADEQHARFIRLTFLWDPETLATGVERLAAAWRNYCSVAARRSPRDPAVRV
jgi:DNA-binding transcriptional MocR family regulator